MMEKNIKTTANIIITLKPQKWGKIDLNKDIIVTIEKGEEYEAIYCNNISESIYLDSFIVKLDGSKIEKGEKE